MSLLPRSLGGRLLVGGGAFITLALILSAALISGILYRFIIGQIDQRLDLEISTVASALLVDPGGRVVLRPFADVPPFDRPETGWSWQVEGAGIDFRSGSPMVASPPPSPSPPPPPRPPPPPPAPALSAPLPPATESDATRHRRVQSFEIASRRLTISATAPPSAISTPLRDALLPLIVSIFVIGAGLLAASLMQVRIGLRPLKRLSADLREVRAGRATHIPSSQPTELAPLVTELNALIDQNTAGLASARLHVANLAHGLKTPLASLALELAEEGRDPEGSMAYLVSQMERAIRHHLGRARAAALAGAPRASTALAPHIADLAAALARIHAGKSVAVSIEIDEGITVACEAQDVDEMLGNLLDNAFRWTKTAVRIAASQDGRSIVITVADDGPGLGEEVLDQAMLPGRRLDETAPGHGFGLAITRELAELYGGSLRLGPTSPTGLTAELTLPAVSA